MINSERFLTAYAVIERKMNEISEVTKYVAFSQLLYKCAKKNRVIASNQQSLREYNELRNAIVHLRGGETEIIAEPSDSVTEDIERIANLLSVNDNVMRFASQPVRTVSPDHTIFNTFDIMDEIGTSKVPVYTKEGYQGIVTVSAIAESVIRHPHRMTVQELIQEETELVVFMSKDDTVQMVVDAFEDAMKKGKQLQACIITEHGKTTEKPAGIITLTDLPKILKHFI